MVLKSRVSIVPVIVRSVIVFFSSNVNAFDNIPAVTFTVLETWERDIKDKQMHENKSERYFMGHVFRD